MRTPEQKKKIAELENEILQLRHIAADFEDEERVGAAKRYHTKANKLAVELKALLLTKVVAQ